MEKVSIIIPVIRPELAKRCLAAIEKNAWIKKENYEVLTAIDENNIGCPKMVAKLTQKARHDWIMFLGDDTIPRRDFIRPAFAAARELPDGWGVVGLNTQDPRGSNPLAHWMAHKKMLGLIPGGAFFAPEYVHAWGDNELQDIAKEDNRWAFAGRSFIDHDHPVNQTREPDEHLDRVYSEETIKADQKTYFIRKRERMRRRYSIKIAYGEPLTFIMIYNQAHFSTVRAIIDYMVKLYKRGWPLGFEFVAPDFPSARLDLIRNQLVRKALVGGCTHLLMVDTDQFTNEDSADYIDRLLSHGKKVVHARVNRRYPPFDHLLMRGDPDNRTMVPDHEIDAGGLIEIDATGCGCVLYDMSIFTDLDDPWFAEGAEDIQFCNKLRENGYKIYCDTSIDFKHLSLLAVDMGTHKLYKKLRGA